MLGDCGGLLRVEGDVHEDKQPYHMHRPDNRPFAFAGLWERWEKGETPVESCTIITMDANGFMQPLHNRMPVILGPADYARGWTRQFSNPAWFCSCWHRARMIGSR